MKVHLLQQAISRFLEEQLHTDAVDWYYTHSMINTFQENWVQPLQETLPDMYDFCLKSEYTQRWWKSDQYKPKEIMLQLIEADPELALIAWKDLYNTDADFEGRISRFEFYCDDLLKMYRQKNIRSVETYHHQDASIVSLYLAGRFPELYTLYPGLDVFQSFCKAIGSPNIPQVDDLSRYMKVAKVVFTFLQRDDLFLKLIAQRKEARHKVAMIPYQVAYEFVSYEGKHFKTKTR